MRPISDMDGETARRLVGIVFDVDDTLTRDGVLEREAFEALWAVRSKGLPAIAVTGRPLGWAEVFAGTWPVSMAVGENGAGWFWRSGRAVKGGFFHPPAERSAHQAMLARIRAQVAAVLPDLREAGDAGLRRCDAAFDVGEAETVSAADVATLVRIIEAEGARSVVSTVHAHAMPGGWDKATGAARAMSEVLGVSPEVAQRSFLFVGDSPNDGPAFAFFEDSAGVSNVRAHVAGLPVPPRWVAVQDRGRGFAEIVDAWLSRRGA
jgi:hypothetical protein